MYTFTHVWKQLWKEALSTVHSKSSLNNDERQRRSAVANGCGGPPTTMPCTSAGRKEHVQRESQAQVQKYQEALRRTE